MSTPAKKIVSDAAATGSNDNLPAQYEVGYGKPPTEHRFQKGRSGNPKGRPKGSRNKPAIDLSFGSRATEAMMKQGAYRTITLREGEDVVELPVIQAVFRALGVSAIKGNRLAQKTFAELMQGVEQADYESKLEHFEAFHHYKHEWTQAIERAEKSGLEVPKPLPHPDDVFLDFATGSVRIAGPLTKEAKARFDQALAVRDEAQEDVRNWAEKYRRARSCKTRQHCLEMWHMDQKLFDTINEALPKHYRVELKDRSYEEGASREGEFEAKYRERS